MPGWRVADPRPGLAALRGACSRPSARPVAAGAFDAVPDGAVCAALSEARLSTPAEARAFVETWFRPVRLTARAGRTGMATAYFEPVLEARRAPEPPFVEPLRRKPDDLVPMTAPDGPRHGAVRDTIMQVNADGVFAPYPVRAVIDETAPDAIAYARVSDALLLHIQGSGRLRFPDGTESRAAFAAHNGRPFRSVSVWLKSIGALGEQSPSNDNVKAWLDAASTAAARAAVAVNPRYVFFREEAVAPGQGPRGAAGRPLTAHGSIAVDPAHHALDGLYWVVPRGQAAPAPRLAVAEDVGGAIKGPLRADLYFGTGDAAGDAAARVKHDLAWWALAPRDAPARDRLAALDLDRPALKAPSNEPRTPSAP